MILAILVGLMADGLAQNPHVFKNGFQYELEAGTFGGSMALSYKFANRFSFGAGYWYGVYYWDSENINELVGDSYMQKVITNYHYYDDATKDKVETSTIQQGRPNSRLTNKMFLSGQIRPMNRAFSFLLGANVGYETIQLDDYWYPYYGDKQQAFFVTPFTGFSFRMRNFYINLKGGVNMVDKIKPETSTGTGDSKLNYSTSNLKATTTIEYPEIDISSLYAVMNFTWTLKLGRGYKEKQRIAEYKASHPKVKKQRDGHGWETFGKVIEGLSVGLDAATEYVCTYNQSGYSSGYSGSSAAGYSKGSGTPATVPTNYDNTFTTGNQVWYEKDNHNGTTTTWIVYPCLRCKGTKKCDFCHGAGQIALTSKVIQCRSCNGTGRCLECNERGQRVTMSVKDANGNGYITDNNGHTYDIAYLRAQEEVRREERQNENSTAEKSVPDVMTCDIKLRLYQTYVHSLEQMRGVARSTYYDNDRRKQIQRDMIKLREEMISMGCSTYVDPIESWNGD